MQCPRCQAENRPGTKFCGQCAAPLATACPSCGASNPPANKFCGQCAAPLDKPAQPRFAAPDSYTPKHLAEKILSSKAALEGERKQITVLFADLKGSMELLADRDPEEARKLLDPVLERMMEAVHRYEGTVNQVMGDGIMALFGAPLAHEDHAVRACYAALRKQESVTQYAEGVFRSQGVPVQIRVGLNSGEVVVRAIGSDLHMDYTAVGQTTHLAARMEQLATPGTVRLTGETVRLAEGYVEVRSLGPIPVKGLTDPVEIFELTGAGQARTRLQAAALRGLTRFVGRDAEVEHLRRVLDRAAGGHGQVVSIVGEAGVGKSRLVYEFTHSHRVQDWLILEASSVSYGKATSYLPVIDLLKGYFKIGDRDNHREMRDKVMGRVLGLDRALEPLLPPLLALLDVPVEDATWQSLDPPQRRQRTLDAVKRLLLRESQVQPLLVVFEDLHWIDGETQALLDSLVDSLGSARLLLLVNYRPEYQHGWSGKTAYSQMRLDALAAESAAELLEALLGDETGLVPLKQLLVKRGNPFFLEETVRMLVETKALHGSRGRYWLTQPLQTLQVPATVQAMLAARIDRLSTEDKRLLQVASVVGKDVPFALLQAIAELPEEALRSGLDRLQAAEFLYETSLYPEVEYTFKHALTHDVAYQSLLHDRRRALHARIADAIERLYRDRLAEQVERLAHHALRGEVWDRALTYFRQAGAKAFARAANREAVECFEEALAVLQHLPERRETLEQAIDLRIDLRHALNSLGQFPRIPDLLREAETLAETLGDQPRLGRVTAFLTNSLFPMGADRAAASGQRALAIGVTLGDFGLQVTARYYLGLAYHQFGDYARAIECFRTNVDVLKGDLSRERFGMPLLPALASRGRLIHSLADVGEFAEASRLADEAVRMADAADDLFSRAIIYSAVGELCLARGQLPDASWALERSLVLCESVPIFFPWTAACLGYVHALTGHIADALSLIEQAVADDQVQRDGTLQVASQTKIRTASGTGSVLVLARLGEGCLLAGRMDEALHWAHETLALSSELKQRGTEACTLRLLGEIASRRDPPEVETAEQHYRQGLALAAELSMRPLVAHCHLGLGKLYRRTGERDQAQKPLTTATTMYREMDMRFWLEQAEAEIRTLGTS
jgi:class 3 adenylate cyclase/tetratricopeptide (TPR) repeat protein